MFGEMLDTTPEARQFYYAHLASLSPRERLALGFAQTRTVRTLAVTAIRREHPGISPEELRVRLAVRLYGREVAERVLGPAPKDAR